MKILIDATNVYIISIGAEIAKLGYEIVQWTPEKTVYDLVRYHKPDLAFVTNADSKLMRCIIKEKIPTILYGYGPFEKQVNCIGVCVDIESNLIDDPLVLAEFGDPNFCLGYYKYDLETDILFSSNFLPTFIGVLNQPQFIFGDYKIKVAGMNYIASPYSVGLIDEQEFGCLAKSSKIVISTNTFEKISLILQGICCITFDNLNNEKLSFIHKEKERRKYIKDHQKLYKDLTSANQAKKICQRIKEWKN